MKAQVPASKEPVGLSREDAKRARGKPMAWDVTVPDTYAKSHLDGTSLQAGAAADNAAIAKKSKYTGITNTHIFIPVAIETGGAWNSEATELIQDIGKSIRIINGESRETAYLFQRISIAIQKGNALAYQSTFITTESKF